MADITTAPGIAMRPPEFWTSGRSHKAQQGRDLAVDRSLTSTIGQREDKGGISSTGTHLLKVIGIPHTRRIPLPMAASLHEAVL